MVDPIISLAFSVHSNKGVYALLLGSGASRSAGIPTGWEIVLDLIRKVSSLKNEDCEPDPEIWYKDKFGEEPDYAVLLDSIEKSASGRSQLLRSYFEPNDQEHEEGLEEGKVPTEAHKAIASLVAGGYIRVIVTTNFDRLLEKAIEEVGVVPTVISTTDAIEGALPLTHTRCSIIKVHGDYLDTRIRNSPSELEQYDDSMNHSLDRIFDEFGLIVCGWSAEWDTALRAAIERCKNHRFTAYWTTKSEPRGVAQKLIQQRKAQIISIQDADSFFLELMEKVFALEDLSKPHPLSAKVAAARLKKYLVEDNYRIRLDDLVRGEREKLYIELSVEHFPANIPFDAEEVRNRLQRYEALAEILQALMSTGCYWGEEKHEDLWVRCLERIADPPEERSGIPFSPSWRDLRLYPALLLLYAGGIASIAARRYKTFSALLTKAKVRDGGNDQPAALILYPNAVMAKMPGKERHYTPLNDHLYDTLREPLREFLPEDILYERCFDRFEYLLALIHADLQQKQGIEIDRVWGPIGRFGRNIRYNLENHIINRIELEVNEARENWLPLKSGLFDGSLEKFLSIKNVFDENVKNRDWN